MKKRKFIAITAGIVLLVPIVTLAATFDVAETVTVPESQGATGNLYTAGGNVTVSGNVENGDLYSAGGSVLANGDVAEDAVLAGGTVNVLGSIGEDLRVAGGTVTVGSKVGGELLAGAGQLNITEDAEIQGHTKIRGSEISLDGKFKDIVEVDGEMVTINGQLDRDAKIFAAKKLVIGPDAVIRGNLEYRSSMEAEIMPGAVIEGKTIFQKVEVKSDEHKKAAVGGFFAFLGVWWFARLFMLFVAALILVAVLGEKSRTLVERAASNFAGDALRGFVAICLFPVVFVLAIISIIGILPAFFGLSIFIAFLLVASVVVPILIGSWVHKMIYKGDQFQVNWKTILLGVFIIQVVRYIPFIGWLFDFVVFLAAFGTTTYPTYKKLFKSDINPG